MLLEISCPTPQVELFIDNFKVVGLSYSCISIWDVHNGNLNCSIQIPGLCSMRVLDGKIFLKARENMSILYFDKLDMEDSMNVVIVRPKQEPQTEVTQKCICYQKLC
jgi:hypothetical protein